MDDFPSRFRAVETDRKLESYGYVGDGIAQMQRHAGTDLHRSGRVNPSSSPWNQITHAKDKGSSSSWPWGLSDAESKRRKRVVRYKAYGTEGKIKASIGSSFRWIKNKYSELVHGS
ncbi:uncharacterized protein LOC115739303 [Rhodamnia argentea]|uniref:Uncharacterized protein LOC115739303 n=1 Tax=Rhodamnia argentea TaxID=178133 RepID=A0A8B8P082_9MYRT|nr:uncharacterized protein LOC115739303 [Rhodamnia argentea]